MKMNLILQGPAEHLAQIGAIADPARAVAIGAHAMRFEDVDAGERVRAAVSLAAFPAGVDATFIGAGRTLSDFRLVAMDMDSTLITIECIDEIADMQGLKAQVSAITEAAMRGELDFSASLRQRVALLEGLDASALERVYDERLRLSPGAEAMLAGVQAAGLKTLLVSGGFTFFSERIRNRLKLDFGRANMLDVHDGHLTGLLLERPWGEMPKSAQVWSNIRRFSAPSQISPQG